MHAEQLPAHIHYAIGIDGGGTSTRARVVHRSGVVVGEGKAGASGLVQGIPQAWRHITQAIAQATEGRLQTDWPPLVPANCALGLGLAGANNRGWHADFLAADPGYARLRLESDAVTALWGAHGGNAGALVIVGTGAIGLALLPDGQQRVSDGWGFPCGDDGSGADIGLRAVNLTQRTLDGRAIAGPLSTAILQATGGTRDALLAWTGAARQFDYATLVPCVFAHEHQDLEAARLIRYSLQQLESLARAVDPTHTLPLVVAGSIGQRMVPRLSALVGACVVPPQGDAMDGALTLCMQ
ncbi:glucosamine kinase GspK [Comamonadaceae bacterium OS-4]|nr:glucosamine kinase GspK [Comamonadaceae bacterium OS-4]